MISWLALRGKDAYEHEFASWEVIAPRATQVGAPFWATDLRRGINGLPPDGPMLDRQVVQRSFDSQDDADQYIDMVCWVAAVRHMLYFWRKLY